MMQKTLQNFHCNWNKNSQKTQSLGFEWWCFNEKLEHADTEYMQLSDSVK